MNNKRSMMLCRGMLPLLSLGTACLLILTLSGCTLTNPVVLASPGKSQARFDSEYRTCTRFVGELSVYQCIVNYGNTVRLPDGTILNRQTFNEYAQKKLAVIKEQRLREQAAADEANRLASEAARKQVMDQALQGDPNAQVMLAEMYLKGDGLTQNDAQALKWYETAATQGNLGAQKTLAEMYRKGDGVVKNNIEAIKWYRLAALQGDLSAQKVLAAAYRQGDLAPKDYKEAAIWYGRAAQQGDAEAEKTLAAMYHSGTGVEHSEELAMNWYLKAAEQGLADAQFQVGLSYKNGKVVPKSYPLAIGWLRKAASQGLADAQLQLGVILMYQNGKYVPENYVEARQWFERAANKGNAAGMDMLGAMYENGQGAKRSYPDALKWYGLAAGKGYADGTKDRDRLQKKVDQYAASLDAIIKQDAAGWISNHYDAGSVKDLDVTEQNGRALEMKAHYTYNSGASGWVRVDFHTQAPCLEYWDTQGTCRPLSVSRISILQAAAAANRASEQHASKAQPTTTGDSFVGHVMTHNFIMCGDPTGCEEE